MNSLKPETLWLETARPLHQHYEDHAFSLMTLLWRRKRVIAAFGVAALVLAGIVTLFLNNKYTADAVIQATLARADQPPPRTGVPIAAPAVSMEAGSMIESEVRFIRSRIVAQRVVTRLDLTHDPAFAVRETLATRALGWLTPMWPQLDREGSFTARAREWFMSVWPWPEAYRGASAESLITDILMLNVKVTNPPRTYLVIISYSSSSPDLSARIANAFAEEYLRAKNEGDARREFLDLAATYGPKHPLLLKAQSKLNDVLNSPQGGNSGQILSLAEATPLPSSPNRPVILGLALFGGLVIGIAVVLFRDRTSNGFRTDAELTADTNLPCLGLVPEAGKARQDAIALSSEAARAIIAAIDLATPSTKSKVTLLTSSVPNEGKSALSTALARTLQDMGRRTLIIDMSPNSRPGDSGATGDSLEDVLDAIALGLPSLEQQPQGVTTLRRSSGIDASHQLLTSDGFSKLLTQARDLYDLILIESPPAILFADALYLGRLADFILHVVRWNSTPRSTVAAALRRMRTLGIRIDGAVLSRIGHEEHLRSGGADPRERFQ